MVLCILILLYIFFLNATGNAENSKMILNWTINITIPVILIPFLFLASGLLDVLLIAKWKP